MWELTSHNEHYYYIIITGCCVVNVLVCALPEDGRWPAKLVEELRICLSIYTVRAHVCLFAFKQASVILLL